MHGWPMVNLSLYQLRLLILMNAFLLLILISVYFMVCVFKVGGDAIRLQEEKEKEEMAAKERALEVRLRELEGRLKRVNSAIEGKPIDASEPIESFSVTKPLTTEGASSPAVPDDSAIDEQLKSVDERLKRLKAMLGE